VTSFSEFPFVVAIPLSFQGAFKESQMALKVMKVPRLNLLQLKIHNSY
jgi:hypothetical protein